MGKYNHYHRVAKLISELKIEPGFHIRKSVGNFKTKRFNGEYNIHQQQFRIYIDERKIPFGVFYDLDRLASCMKTEREEIEMMVM